MGDHCEAIPSQRRAQPSDANREQQYGLRKRSTGTAGSKAQAKIRMYPRAFFLEQLRRERLRADRSMAPLSLVLIRLNEAAGDVNECARLVFRLLEPSMRETDSIGYFAKDKIALLLPDTTEVGAQAVVNKLFSDHPALRRATTVVAYPDEWFDRLAAQSDDALQMNPMLFTDAKRSRAFQSRVKRFVDIVGAIVGLLVFSPVMLITAAAIKLTSPGPVIFKQIRLGKDFTPFVFYKFRSMHVDADDRIHRDYLADLIRGDLGKVDQGGADGAFYKIKSDPRVTRVGDFIRKTSIDELPQFLNVLKGEMSLVGPRPPLPYEVDKYRSWHLRRILEVRPGLTGLWQVEGRSQTTFDEMVRLDLRYSRNWSLLLDLKLMLRTVKVVLNCRGAA